MKNFCPKCGNELKEGDFFCPNCGTKIKDKPPSTSFMGQLKLYLLGIIVPPFGIIPAFKYLRVDDRKSKIIGVVAIIINIVALVVITKISIDYFNKLNERINEDINMFNSY